MPEKKKVTSQGRPYRNSIGEDGQSPRGEMPPGVLGCSRGGASGNWRSGLCSDPTAERSLLPVYGMGTQAPGATPPPHHTAASQWRLLEKKVRKEGGENS